MKTDGATLKRYFVEISKAPLLSAEEEKSLARRYRRGDAAAKRRLVEANLRFVVKMAIPYSNQGLSLEDLIQEGNIGLLEGIEKFDPERGFRLTTYVSWWIRLALQRALEQKGSPIRIPANKQEQIRKIKTFSRVHESEKGRHPSSQETAKALKMNVKTVEELLLLDATFCSLDQATGEEAHSLQTVLEDTRVERPEEGIARREMKRQLNTAMEVLSDKERDVLHHRYGLDEEKKGLSLRQIGRIIGLSAEGVRRIEEQALRKLRRPMVRAYVEGFV
jgi:RNA polymerase primary sigma factor